MSVNDILEMRLALDGLTMKRVNTSYTVGAKGSGREPKGELLITNFNPLK